MLYSVIEKNDDNVKLRKDFSQLQEVHISLCIGKALFTGWVNDAALKGIQACGGHGFLHSSGIAPQITTNFANAILEGENNVLQLQIARELMKSFNLVAK